MTNYLTLIIERTSVVPCDPSSPAEVAEVMSRAVFFPEQGVIFHEIEPGIRVEGCAIARRADNLTLVVDLGRHAVQVAGVSRELPDLAIFPDDRLKLAHWAARVLRAVLRKPGHVAPAVDH